MKDSYRSISLVRLCRLLGITRQAFYKHFWVTAELSIQQQLVLQQLSCIRKLHPAMGGRKLHYLLQSFFQEHQIKMGRDGLFDLMVENGLLVRKTRKTVRTTQSCHYFKKHPNLITNWTPGGPQQLWVADITYVRTNRGFLYLSLLTDAYSHKIVGFNIADNMSSINTLKALEMALQCHPDVGDLIHHSDRGLQYCSDSYVSMLRKHRIKISMTQSGDPLENPLAERINGILKNEYIEHYPITSIENAQQLINDIVNRYNNERPHLSINLLTPDIVHTAKLPVNRKWNKPRRTLNIVT
jgi:putative transposase